MKAKELIKQLTKLVDDYGDRDVEMEFKKGYRVDSGDHVFVLFKTTFVISVKEDYG